LITTDQLLFVKPLNDSLRKPTLIANSDTIFLGERCNASRPVKRITLLSTWLVCSFFCKQICRPQPEGSDHSIEGTTGMALHQCTTIWTFTDAQTRYAIVVCRTFCSPTAIPSSLRVQKVDKFLNRPVLASCQSGRCTRTGVD